MVDLRFLVTFTQEEAKTLTDVLGVGKLPASAKVVQAGSWYILLGQESINAGLMSFALHFNYSSLHYILLRWCRCLCNYCDDI